jgi:2-C-methyl-D-erythritol 4-phosphate cytidylyltransferase
MNVAIVVAAGKGTRLGGERPKQFLELRGVPIIVHTLRQFERSRQINEVITVLPAEDMAGFQSLVQQFDLQKAKQAIAGGATRAQSVRNGLKAISDSEIVAVHDGVRPFVTPEEIDQTVAAARQTGAAVLTAAVADTIKRVQDGKIVETVARTQLRRALTPQCFRLEILQRAYEQLDELESAGFEITDESVLVERLGVEVVAVDGSARNIKITDESDLAVANQLLTTDY